MQNRIKETHPIRSVPEKYRKAEKKTKIKSGSHATQRSGLFWVDMSCTQRSRRVGVPKRSVWRALLRHEKRCGHREKERLGEREPEIGDRRERALGGPVEGEREERMGRRRPEREREMEADWRKVGEGSVVGFNRKSASESPACYRGARIGTRKRTEWQRVKGI